jgi:large subunit ribosomal protein L5
MEKIKISKVTVNIGVGESGDRLQKAEKLLQDLLGQKPVRCHSKASLPDFGIKKREPIGVKVTLRKDKAIDFLNKALEAVEHTIKPTQFDTEGNLSFGVKEYIELPGTKYDPDVGMFGMDVSVRVERPGYRVSRRRKQPCKIPQKFRVTKEESMDFFKKNFKVMVE